LNSDKSYYTIIYITLSSDLKNILKKLEKNLK